MKKTLILIIFFITGCTKYTDLKELAIIKNIGIDYDKSYTIYAKIYDEITKDNEPITKTIEVHGNSIIESFDKLKDQTSKELFFSHNDLLVLSERLKDNNYQEIINYFITNNIRNDFFCLFSFDIKKLFQESKYDEIENYLKTNKEIKNVKSIPFYKLMNSFLNDKPFYLSMINYQNEKINHIGNYKYYHNAIERNNNE